MVRLKRSFLLLVTIFIYSFFNEGACSVNKPVLDFLDKVEAARESFEEVYYEQVKQDLFGDFYNNNLIIGTRLDSNFYENGQILLTLIDWLEKNNNRDTRYLLKKLNKYFYLQLYRLVNQIDMGQKKEGKLLGLLHELYHVKMPTPYGIVAPFRTDLSQISILIAIFNASQLPYEAKREALNFMLDKVQKKMLIQNKELLHKDIDENKIKEFIQAMQTFATKEPLVQSSAIKKFLLTMLIVGVIIGAGYLTWSYVIKPKKDDLKIWLNDFLHPAEATAVRLLEKVKHDFPEMLQDGLHKLAVRENGDHQHPNPDLKIVGEQLGHGIGKGVLLAGPRGLGAGAVSGWNWVRNLWPWGHGAAPAAQVEDEGGSDAAEEDVDPDGGE